MYPFKGPVVSNFYISDYKVQNSDPLIQFAICARNDTGRTSARKAMIYKDIMFVSHMKITDFEIYFID
jgi:hypothetical protein